MSDSESDTEVEAGNSLIPVFCISENVGLQTIRTFLKRDAAYINEASYRLVILPSAERRVIESIQSRSKRIDFSSPAPTSASTSTSASAPFSTTTHEAEPAPKPSETPTLGAGPSKDHALFDSPFAGWSLDDVNTFFRNTIRPLFRWSKGIFIVLDDLTARDEETCLLLCTWDPTDEDAKWHFADRESEEEGHDPWPPGDCLRADFYAARQLFTMVDIGQEFLLDNRDPRQVQRVHTMPMDL